MTTEFRARAGGTGAERPAYAKTDEHLPGDGGRHLGRLAALLGGDT